MSEVWKDIPDFDNLYQISSWGRVKSLRSGSGCEFEQILLPRKTYKGYLTVSACINGARTRNRLIHRLVAKAFLENPENKPQVNHKDLNKENNNLSNLEWVTHMENIAHAVRFRAYKNRVGEDNSNAKLTEAQVKEMLGLWKIRENINKTICRKSLALKYNVTVHCIDNIVYNKKNWKYLL